MAHYSQLDFQILTQTLPMQITNLTFDSKAVGTLLCLPVHFIFITN